MPWVGGDDRDVLTLSKNGTTRSGSGTQSSSKVRTLVLKSGLFFVHTQSIVIWSEVSQVLTSSEVVVLPVSHHHV